MDHRESRAMRSGQRPRLLDCDAELPIAQEAIDIGVVSPAAYPINPGPPHWSSNGCGTRAKTIHTCGVCLYLFHETTGFPIFRRSCRPPASSSAYRVEHRLPSDLHRCTSAARRSATVLERLFFGQWEGDALVVQTIGLRDDLWLDLKGNPVTSSARLTERLRRPDSWKPRNRIHRRRPENLHETLDGHVQGSHCARCRAAGRNLFRERKELQHLPDK